MPMVNRGSGLEWRRGKRKEDGMELQGRRGNTRGEGGGSCSMRFKRIKEVEEKNI